MWDPLILKLFSAAWAAFVISVASDVAQTAFGQSGLPQLEEMWKRGKYAEVLPRLIDYRERTWTKNPQIDYMIATSACRIPVHRQSGNQFFSWILYNYNLSSENRATIESERQRCNAETPPQRLKTAIPATLVGVSYNGKGGTEILARSNGNGSAEVVVPIPPEIFIHRVFSPESAEAAAVQVKKTLGPGTRVEHAGHFLLVVPPQSREELVAQSPDSILPTRLTPPEGAEPPNGPVANPPASGEPQPPAANAPPGPAPPPTLPPAVARNSSGPDVQQRPNPNPNGNIGSIMVQQRPMPSTERPPQSISISRDEYDLRHVGFDLERYLEFYASEYGMRRPRNLITVYFAGSVGGLQGLARTLHGITLTPGSIGYSFPPDQSMAGWASGSVYGTFVHELFHMMVRYNFGDIPPWLDEGMAALYEVSRFEGARAIGVSNWRGEILRQSWAKRPRLQSLLQMNREAFDGAHRPSDDLFAAPSQSVNHATARYFILYLQKQRKLKPVYSAFAKRPMSSEPATQAVRITETVLGRSLDQIDSDFTRWFQSHP